MTQENKNSDHTEQQKCTYIRKERLGNDITLVVRVQVYRTYCVPVMWCICTSDTIVPAEFLVYCIALIGSIWLCWASIVHPVTAARSMRAVQK